MVLEGPIHRRAFEAYVDQILAPELRYGDVIVMDNLSSHKSLAARAAIDGGGAELRFLPPYSPDFKLIENAFAKLKALLRNANERTFRRSMADHRRPDRLPHYNRVRKILYCSRI